MRCDYDSRDGFVCLLNLGHDGTHQPVDRIAAILHILDRIEQQVTTDASALADVQAAVTTLTSTVAAAVTELGTLQTDLANLGANGNVAPSDLESIATQLGNITGTLNTALGNDPAPVEPPADAPAEAPAPDAS